MYFKSIRGMGISGVPHEAYPLILFIAFVLWLVFPWSRRRGVWITIRNTALAPLFDVKFRDTFVGDVLTSVVKVLTDLVYTFCFYTSGACCHWQSGQPCEQLGGRPA
jgi:hypothetical protein